MHEDGPDPAAIVACAEDAIVGEAPDGTITCWNRGAERIFGWTAAEMVGQCVQALVPADLAAEAGDLADRVRRGESVIDHETQRRAKHTGRVDVALTASLVRDQDGAVSGVATIVRDVSRRRRMDTAVHVASTELDDAHHDLQAALAQARASEERSRSFLADAAHQLRGPIAGMQACAEALLVGPGQDERQRLLANMVRETAHAGRLIAALLRMARLDQGQPLTPEPCDLVALCTDEADRLYSLAPNLDISLRAEPVQQACPRLDGEAVREIIANLLDNARRYAVSRIDLAVATTTDAVHIRVADDGPGLAAEDAERAFDRFVTLDHHGGSGLGLSIGRSLARAHGGTLTYEDGCFVLRLPTSEPDS